MHAVRWRAHILLSFLVRPSSLMRCCAFLSCFAVLASTFLSCSEQPFLCSLPVIRLVALRMYSRVSHALRLCAFRWRAGSLAAHRAGCLARSASASRSLWYVGPYCCAAGSFRIMCVCEEPALFNNIAWLRAFALCPMPRLLHCLVRPGVGSRVSGCESEWASSTGSRQSLLHRNQTHHPCYVFV